MNVKQIKLVAMDLDGTLSQHKQHLPDCNKQALKKLAEKYMLVMVGAGQTMRIFNQMEGFAIDVIGNYGMQYSKYNHQTCSLEVVRDLSVGVDRDKIEKTVSELRQKYGFTEFKGESVEFHPSGCVTFPILGTKAELADKLAFDPDRKKRRAIYEEVCSYFPDYNGFVGGSSSFDFAPKPFDKYYALDLYCKEKGITHEQAVFIGDDYGLGGNDSAVYNSDFNFLTIDDYLDFPKVIKELL